MVASAWCRFLNDGRGPLLQRLAQMALRLSLPVFIVGREQPPTWPLSEVQFLSDAELNQGPLGGLVAALKHADAVLCLACDFPALEMDAFTWLRDQSNGKDKGFVLQHDHGIEPLCALYTQHCRSEAERRLQIGERALHRLIAACEMPNIAAPVWIVHQLQNINTPAEWEQFKQRQTCDTHAVRNTETE
jgi:molybdopterin-guanine dinucleotide biosynthesis protein A